ncbi:hypothetical protein FOXYSP1_11747 [Fusarium oxysporum f. sp. phaseoli]
MMARKPSLLQEVPSVAHPADNIVSLCHHFCSGRSSTVAMAPAYQLYMHYLAQSPSAIALSLLQHIYAP